MLDVWIINGDLGHAMYLGDAIRSRGLDVSYPSAVDTAACLRIDPPPVHSREAPVVVEVDAARSSYDEILAVVLHQAVGSCHAMGFEVITISGLVENPSAVALFGEHAYVLDSASGTLVRIDSESAPSVVMTGLPSAGPICAWDATVFVPIAEWATIVEVRIEGETAGTPIEVSPPGGAELLAVGCNAAGFVCADRNGQVWRRSVESWAPIGDPLPGAVHVVTALSPYDCVAVCDGRVYCYEDATHAWCEVAEVGIGATAVAADENGIACLIPQHEGLFRLQVATPRDKWSWRSAGDVAWSGNPMPAAARSGKDVVFLDAERRAVVRCSIEEPTKRKTPSS